MRRAITGIAVLATAITATGCATHSNAGVGTPPSSTKTSATPSISFTTTNSKTSNGVDDNSDASIPNPGTGKDNPALLRALLPVTAAPRLSAAQLAPAVVAMPDTDPRSTFIALRQSVDPVVGPSQCVGWTHGLSQSVLESFNQPGVQLAIASQLESPADQPGFTEAIVTGPPRVLSALADPPLPAACRAITAQTAYPGGVKPLAAARIGAGTRAYEVTGTGKNQVWEWAEVVSGPDFVLEIRIPYSSPPSRQAPQAQLPEITSRAYQRALTALAGP